MDKHKTALSVHRGLMPAVGGSGQDYLFYKKGRAKYGENDHKRKRGPFGENTGESNQRKRERQTLGGISED